MADSKFALPEVDTIDEVPEEYRAFYFEKDGKIKRQDPAAMASTMAKIRRENERLSGEVEQHQTRLTHFVEVFGDDADPESLKALKEKAAQADQLPSDKEVEKRIKTVEENYKKQLAAKDAELASREETIESVTVLGQLREALKSADANDDGLELLPKFMREQVEKEYLEGGKIKLYPLDEDGTRMYAEDGSEATLLDLANKIKAKRPIFFHGSKASGMGAGQDAVAVPANSKNWWKMSTAEKVEFSKKHGPEKAAALMSQSAQPDAAE